MICHQIYQGSLECKYASEEELIHTHLTCSEEVFPRPVCLGIAHVMAVIGNKIAAICSRGN